jgi:modification methylase
MPNFRGVRFTNAHENLIWAQKESGAPYTFNHHAMKALNEGLQMRSDWYLPICTGSERLRENGQRAHPTQKPEALLYRVIQASSNPGDVVLDPFFGTGTTGVVAKRLHRHWIGIERQADYVRIAQMRIDNTPQEEYNQGLFETPNPRKRPRIPFGQLLEHNLLQPGQVLYFGQRGEVTACVLADGAIECNGQRGSIHQIARSLRQTPCNGWEMWYYTDDDSDKRISIDHLRQIVRKKMD